MKLTLEPASGLNLIRAYGPDGIRLGERHLNASCIVSAHAIRADWPPRTAGEITAAHAELILELEPELVLLGTGMRQEFPSMTIRTMFVSRGIGLEAMDLGAACRTFNVLVQEDRRVVAALLLAPPTEGGS